MSNTACSVIDLGRYREQRGLPLSARSTMRDGNAQPASQLAPAFASSSSPDLSEALALLGRELRSAELRLIDLAATIDELYAQVDDMARR